MLFSVALCRRYMTGSHTGGRWLAYFAAQAPLVVAERLALRVLKAKGISVPRPARVLATLTISVLLAHHLFW